MKLDLALKLAERIVTEITPYCDKVVIAGSIRRKREEVGDIDIVVEPRDRAGLRQRVMQSNPRIIAAGPQNLEVELQRGVRLDLWIATGEQPTLFGEMGTNFGSLLLCRTGCVTHNIKLVEFAKRKGLRWNPYYGVFDAQGKCLASETEEAVYAALGLKWIDPVDREPAVTL